MGKNRLYEIILKHFIDQLKNYLKNSLNCTETIEQEQLFNRIILNTLIFNIYKYVFLF